MRLVIVLGVLVLLPVQITGIDIASSQEVDSTFNWLLTEFSAERGTAITVGEDGCAYITGETNSLDFPITSGALDTNLSGHDAFVVKLDPTGKRLEYSTYLGGSGSESGCDITVDNYGNTYVTGSTTSLNFPISDNAFDETYDGRTDVFMVKLDPTGSRLDFSTFLGGSHSDYGRSIAVDNLGQAYVTGWTLSRDFPTTCGAFDTSYNDIRPARWDAFVAKLNSTGSDLIYGTFLGGKAFDWGYGIAADDSGNAYVTGHSGSDNFPTTVGAFDRSYNLGSSYGDVFVTKINAKGSDLVYSTWLGGGGWDYGRSISLDDSLNVYVTGYTNSLDFPTTTGAFDTTHEGIHPDYAFDIFVSKFNFNGSDLIFSTFLGGNDGDAAYSISVDHSGYASITGLTYSVNFPTTTDAFDTTFNGSKDAFILKLNPSGTDLDYSTYLGGDNLESGIGIAVDDSADVYTTGYTTSENFPTTAGALDTIYHGSEDAFVTKFNITTGSIEYSTFLAGDSTYPFVPVRTETARDELPRSSVLYQNCPNPFNTNTEIRYQIVENSHVTLKIFNILGQEIKSFVDSYRETGLHTATWDGHDDWGFEVASGIYFCRLQSGDFTKTIKMVLLR